MAVPVGGLGGSVGGRCRSRSVYLPHPPHRGHRGNEDREETESPGEGFGAVAPWHGGTSSRFRDSPGDRKETP